MVARCSDELVGLHFIHTRHHQDRLERVAPLLYAPLEPDEALTEAVFVFPAFRGRGVAPTMLRASLARLADHGYRRGLAIIDIENEASLRAVHAAGYTAEPTMRVDTWRFGRRTSEFRATDPATWRRSTEATARAPASRPDE